MLLSDDKQLKSAIVEIAADSSLYPKEWQGVDGAPAVIYALGDTSLLQERKFGVVGSRTAPANALKLGAGIAEELSADCVIVTGTADGGDTAAIEGGLKTGRIICVLAGGFSALPQGNLALLERVAKSGLLLALHPFETDVRAYSYEYRNRLLAALCEGVLVLSAGEKSGALITAKHAFKQQKPVFALPYPPNSAAGVGCNALIKQGGRLTECALDVASVLNIDLSVSKKKIFLTADEEKLYAAIKEFGEGHVSELSAKSGIPSFKARAVLSALEVKGLIVALGGNRYAIV